VSIFFNLHHLEKEAFQIVLKQAEYDKRRAAEMLKINLRTLRYKMETYDLESEQKSNL